jgi:hypothetical protein
MRCLVPFKRAAAAIGVAVCLALPGTAQTQPGQIPVDLELVLAVDVSLSMDLDELRLQREGYVEAFRDPEVIAAIRANGIGRIGVTYVEWAGVNIQKVTLPWTLIDGEAAASAFADRLSREPIFRAQKTSITGSLLFASRLFEASGFKGKRKVVDISGDGPNNDGPPVVAARDALIQQGITINGLPITYKEASGWFDLANLDEYYEDCVIGGFASFSIAIRHKREFARAIKRKLLLEISERPAQVWRAQAGPTDKVGPSAEGQPGSEPRVDCLVGEKRWQQYMGGRRGTY